MDLFDLPHTDAEQAALDAIRSEINIARGTLRYRLDCGFNQKDLANIARTTQARVSGIESMKGDPKLSTLSRVALALGCMIDMVPIAVASVSATPAGFNPLTSKDIMATAGGTAFAASAAVPRAPYKWAGQING